MQKKTALIIGASGGIGSVIAKRVAEENVHTILLSRNVKKLDALSSGINRAGFESSFYKLDVTDTQQIKTTLNTIIKKHKNIHYLVYCAGAAFPLNPLVKMSNSYFDKVIDVNLKGVFLLLKEILPVMTNQKYGRIVIFSSSTGKRGIAFASAYSAAKAGVINLIQAVASEIAEKDITINALCPSGIHTKFCKEAWESLARLQGITYEEFKKRRLMEMGINRDIKADETYPLIKMLLFESTNAITGQSFNISGAYGVK